jgi:hypothetical protein
MLANLRFLRQIVQSPTQRKHALRWWRSLQGDYFLRAKQPWLVFDAVDFLKACDLCGKQVFEYGSGGSTLFWITRGATVVSVEHDPIWYLTLSSYLSGAPGVDYRLIVPEHRDVDWRQNRDPANPFHYTTGDESFENHSFHSYVCQIDAFPAHHFDLVLIDGRARPACIVHSADKVRAGGLLVLDNAERDYYFAQTEQYLSRYKKKEYVGVGPLNTSFWKTNIYTKES